MDKNFTLSEGYNPNYTATVCKITKLEPIENSEFLLRTVVDGFDIVVSNATQIGDIVIYCPTGSALNVDFLSVNNLFELPEYERNTNFKEVEQLINKGNKALVGGDKETHSISIAEAKKLCGFFNKQGRVKTITLRGIPSIGFITPLDSLIKWQPSLANLDWEKLVGCIFDTVNKHIFIKKYVKPIKEVPERCSAKNKREKHVKKFDRLREEQFEFHYDTGMLNTNIHNISPNDVVTITKKMHGTSSICSKILCNKELTLKGKIKKFLGCKLDTVEYDYIYSSRSTIKNRYINKGVNSFYQVDVWGWASDHLKPLLDDGMMIYSEIYGYLPNSSSFIQKNHDYGCDPSPSHPKHTLIMPYRITMVDKFGNKKEKSVTDVFDWTTIALIKNPNLPLQPIEILYHGTLSDLYPDVEINEEWGANILVRLKNEKRFHMEEPDPWCSKFPINGSKKFFQAPMEGIVVRKDEDVERNLSRAWKLKTAAHYNMETKEQDEGEVDLETLESCGSVE